MVLKRWAENLGRGFLKLKKKFNGSLTFGKSLRKSTLCVLLTRDCKFSLQEAIVVSRILGAFAPKISSFYTTGYITPPYSPLLLSSHIVCTILLVCMKNGIRSLLLNTCLFIQKWKKFDKNFAPKITSFYTTMIKYDKNFAHKITSFYTTMKKMR